MYTGGSEKMLANDLQILIGTDGRGTQSRRTAEVGYMLADNNLENHAS